MSCCCWNSAGGTTGDKLWMEHESAALHEEQNRRETALKRFLNHQKGCRENPAAQHENPPNYNIHIWWTDPNTGKSDWIKRLPLPAGEVREWRTAFLKQKDPAVVSEPDSDWQTPGNKVLIEGRAYCRLWLSAREEAVESIHPFRAGTVGAPLPLTEPCEGLLRSEKARCENWTGTCRQKSTPLFTKAVYDPGNYDFGLSFSRSQQERPYCTSAEHTLNLMHGKREMS